MVTAEERVAAARAWFEECSQAKSVPSGLAPWVEPDPPTPHDMTAAAGIFTHVESLSQHRCRNCQRGIPVGQQHISHRLWSTSTVTNYYHEACVILP